MKLCPGDRVEDLFRDELRIIQNDRLPKYNSDSVLLANYSEVKDGWRVCDLCSGTGIVPLLLTSRARDLSIVGVEIVPEMVELARRNVAINKLEANITIELQDIRKLTLPSGQFDFLTVNPPYFEVSQGKVSLDSVRATTRSQGEIELKDVATAAYRLLKSKGKFAMVYRPTGLQELLSTLVQAKLGVTRIRFVHHSSASKAFCLLVEGKKDVKGQLIVENPLIVTQSDGKLSQEINEIYFAGKSLESGLK